MSSAYALFSHVCRRRAAERWILNFEILPSASPRAFMAIDKLTILASTRHFESLVCDKTVKTCRDAHVASASVSDRPPGTGATPMVQQHARRHVRVWYQRCSKSIASSAVAVMASLAHHSIGRVSHPHGRPTATEDSCVPHSRPAMFPQLLVLCHRSPATA